MADINLRRRRAQEHSVRDLLIAASASLLSSDIANLFLAERHEVKLRMSGVQRISDLATRHDDQLLAIDGIAKGALRDIKLCVQVAIDRDLSRHSVSPPRYFAADADSLSFMQLMDRLSTDDLCKPINCLELPFRCATRLAGLQVTMIGHLSQYSRESLLEVDGFGRKSFQELEHALRDFYKSNANAERMPVEQTQTLDVVVKLPATLKDQRVQEDDHPELYGDDLSRSLDVALELLNDRVAHVLRHRMGYRVPARTLEDLGQELSITRERVRQIQRKGLAWLQRYTNIAEALTQAMVEILAARKEPLYAVALPAEHRYFRHSRNAEQVVPFLLDQICSESYFTLSLGGAVILSRISDDEWTACKAQARSFIASSVDRRLPEEVVRAGIDSLVGEKAPELSENLWSWAQEFAHFGGAVGERRLVAYGRGVEQMVLAVLEDSQEPLHYSGIADRVAERYGEQDVRRVANAASEVALLLDRGAYGTERHLPLSRNEASYVASLCEALVSESSSRHRQWHCREFIEELSSTEPLVARLNMYEISAVLKLHSDLHYVGRQVWVAAKEGRGGVHMRLDIRNAIEAVVEEEGAPLAASEIYRRVSTVRGVGHHFQIHPKGRLIRVGPSFWGIAERDVPWYCDREVVLSSLQKSLAGRGSAFHVLEIAENLTPVVGFDIEAWHVYGAAQVDSRFKNFPGEFVGLCDWPISGRLTIQDAINQLRSEGERYWSLAEIQATIEARIERQVSADSIRWALRNVGASYNLTRGLWDLQIATSTDEDGSPQLF